MREVLREEKKYLLNMTEYKKLNRLLEKVLTSDIHNKGEGYIVRSLYFDTLYDRDYHEKLDGVKNRRKIRLRIYDPNSDYAYLEIKQKEGQYQKKRSLKISKEDALELIKKNYDVLLKYDDKFSIECYSLLKMYCYVPKSVVEYDRTAYIAKENNIRITFDRNIRCSESNFNIFDEKLLLNPVFPKDQTVLEVKFNGFLLSYIKDLIDTVDKQQLSVSKYCLSRTSLN